MVLGHKASKETQVSIINDDHYFSLCPNLLSSEASEIKTCFDFQASDDIKGHALYNSATRPGTVPGG